jgi:PIN domain nuclease of toxin-antitoxin system
MAVLQREAGSQIVEPILESAVVSSVNLAEMQTKLVLAGLEDELAWRQIAALRCQSIPFDDAQAHIAGSLARLTKPYGLSLGDRAYLALAIHRKAKVYTTDRAWKSLSLGIDIEVIR